MVLEGLPVDVEGELAHFLVEVNSRFNAANVVREGDRENRSSGAEGNASFIFVGLVESDVNSLVLGEMLGS